MWNKCEKVELVWAQWCLTWTYLGQCGTADPHWFYLMLFMRRKQVLKRLKLNVGLYHWHMEDSTLSSYGIALKYLKQNICSN